MGFHRERSANQIAPPASFPLRGNSISHDVAEVTSSSGDRQLMLGYITTSRQASIQAGGRRRRESQGTGQLMGTPHVATHDRTCAGNHPVADRKHAAGMSQQVEKGKGGGDSTHPASYSSVLHFQEQLSPLRLQKKRKKT